MNHFLEAANPIKIEVKKSSTSTYWYTGHVGKEFIVESVNIRDFFVYDGDKIRPILKIDAELK